MASSTAGAQPTPTNHLLDATFERQVLWHLSQLQSKINSLHEKVYCLQEWTTNNNVPPPRKKAEAYRSNASDNSPYRAPSIPEEQVDSSDHSQWPSEMRSEQSFGKLLRSGSSNPKSKLLRGCTQKTLDLNDEEKETLTKNQKELIDSVYQRARQQRRGLGIWRLLEDPNSSKMAMWYSRLVPYFIIFTVFCALLEFIPQGEFLYVESSVRLVLQFCLEGVFVVELSLRFMSCPSPLVFWLDYYNVIEAASAVTWVIRAVANFMFDSQSDGNGVNSALVCIVPVLRLMKLVRRFEHFQLLISAFMSSLEVLPVLLFTLLLISLTFAALVFNVERDVTVESFPETIWFIVVTMSTVGYGDIAPETTAGKIMVGILIIISGLYLAIPIGIVGHTFSGVWVDRGRLLLMQRLRGCVTSAGYTFADLQSLFQMFDLDGNGSLDIDEFTTLIEMMKVSMKQEWISQVFETFDDVGEGCIGYDEFLRGLFPHAHLVASRYSSKVGGVILGGAASAPDRQELKPHVRNDRDDGKPDCQEWPSLRSSNTDDSKRSSENERHRSEPATDATFNAPLQIGGDDDTLSI